VPRLTPLRRCGGLSYPARFHAGMLQDDPVNESRDMLRRLAANDEASVRAVLACSPISGPAADSPSMLDRRTRVLVQLAALLVVDASTESLRWAADLAGTNGADDGAVAAVLVAAGFVAGSAQLVAIAPRLALALGLEPAEGNSLTEEPSVQGARDGFRP
jgi:4-carboxymuconolactone decarboxylase